VLHFSRNFGHQAATPGRLWTHATGDVDRRNGFRHAGRTPACIGRFLEKWREGYDVVYAIRTGRKENAVKEAALLRLLPGPGT